VAARIGFPVLIKASAGGGGKGMRRVDLAEDFAAALAACRREALASFGSDHVLIEKYILQPRHIEVQVFADMHGNVVHLFERDCSVQRRHQKVLEEAPAPGMTPKRREAMGQAAVQVARAVGYVGAGTVEFIAPRQAPGGGEAPFFFMEMNTRLQVEHPVTEMVTGLDLVEWQLRVAAGEPLPSTQERLALRGHAIEARLYAEDADQGFTPATGSVEFFDAPPASEHVRMDAGVGPGDAITPHYDPMIAKLIVWDADRDAARERMRAALAQTRIVGVVNNVAFLARLVDSPSFAAALLDTDLIERDADALAAASRAPAREWWLLAALAQLEHESRRDLLAGRGAGAWEQRDGWRANGRAQRHLQLVWHGAQGLREQRALSIGGPADREPRGRAAPAARWLALDGTTTACEAQWRSAAEAGRLRAWFDGQVREATVVQHGNRWHLFGGGPGAPGRVHVHEVFECRDPLDELHGRGAGEAEPGTLLSPMPGRVVALLVEPGTQVERETPLLIVEAMKMEHTVRAPAAGLLRCFCVAVGDQVAMAEQLMEFEPDRPAAA
jgi:3-methylcrotonyl-CoA carboxylase alpha subunit